MHKSITISFRTSEHLREILEKISIIERRTLSSTIENVIYKYAEDNGYSLRTQKEKRRFPRKKVFLPATLTEAGSDDKIWQAGIVLDISLGGIQISAPVGLDFKIQEDKENSKLSILVPLPKSKNAINLECVPRHIDRSNGDKIIGASFSNIDFNGYQTLQEYLIN